MDFRAVARTRGNSNIFGASDFYKRNTFVTVVTLYLYFITCQSYYNIRCLQQSCEHIMNNVYRPSWFCSMPLCWVTRIKVVAMKMKALLSFETPVHLCLSTQRNNSEDFNFQHHHCEELQSCMHIVFHLILEPGYIRSLPFCIIRRCTGYSWFLKTFMVAVVWSYMQDVLSLSSISKRCKTYRVMRLVTLKEENSIC